MLRLTEVRLGLDHHETEIKAAILRTLGIAEHDLLGFRVFRRGHDARKTSEVVFVYTIDVEVRDEDKLLQRLHRNRHVMKAANDRHRFRADASPRRHPAPPCDNPFVFAWKSHLKEPTMTHPSLK